MKMLSGQLDATVEVADDDQGRIVLLPRDDRRPLRVDKALWTRVASYQDGHWIIAPAQTDGETDRQTRAGPGLVAMLDREGLLAGRRQPPERRVVRWHGAGRLYDRLAGVLAAPLVRLLPVRGRATLLFAVGLLACAALAALWWSVDGRMFVGVANRHWWIGILGFILLVPPVHEFSHAFAARVFELPVSAVGAQHHGGLRWSPFVEVRRAVLTSRAEVRILLPLAGVICNLLIALGAAVVFVRSSPGTLTRDLASIVLLLAHLRVMIDGGFGARTDATQAVRYAREYCTPARARLLVAILRGGVVLFGTVTVLMLALSVGAAGARIGL